MEWEGRERLDVSTYLFWHGTSLPIRTYYWRTVSVCLLLLSAVRVPIPSSAQPKVSQSIDGADGHCFFRETSSMRKEGMEGGRNVVVWVLFPLSRSAYFSVFYASARRTDVRRRPRTPFCRHGGNLSQESFHRSPGDRRKQTSFL